MSRFREACREGVVQQKDTPVSGHQGSAAAGRAVVESLWCITLHLLLPLCSLLQHPSERTRCSAACHVLSGAKGVRARQSVYSQVR